jgi:GntR family transcriptional regulator
LDTLSEYIRLDFRSQEPIYLQIVRQVEKLVHEDILKPGDQLPTVRQMAIDLRINFSTVARAYHILDEQKLISTQRGRGTYIWEDSNLDGQAAEPSLLSAVEADQNQRVSQLVHDFIAEAIQQGFTLDEIELAFDREIAGRKGVSD